MDYPELIQKITYMTPEVMYRDKFLVDVNDVLNIIRDAERKDHGVLQDASMEKVQSSIHSGGRGIVRNLSAKGCLLSGVHSTPQDTSNV